MELKLSLDDFFPRSVITTPFGWDTKTFPTRPRLHHAVDRAGSGIVHTPVEAESSQWIDDDAEGCSVLRLFFPGGEFRMLHFIRGELESAVLSAALVKAPIPAGTPIGPTGNHGLSVPLNGGTGRHVHYCLILEPGVYDDKLKILAGAGWNNDHMSDYRSQYGKAFIADTAARGVRWMNEFIVARADPYYDGKLRFVVNTTKLWNV